MAATAHAGARSTTALHASTSFAAGSTASRVDGVGRDGGEGGAEREGGGDDAEDVPAGGGGGFMFAGTEDLATFRMDSSASRDDAGAEAAGVWRASRETPTPGRMMCTTARPMAAATRVVTA